MLHEFEEVWEDRLRRGSLNRQRIQRKGVPWLKIGRRDITRLKWVPWAVQKAVEKDM